MKNSKHLKSKPGLLSGTVGEKLVVASLPLSFCLGVYLMLG